LIEYYSSFASEKEEVRFDYGGSADAPMAAGAFPMMKGSMEPTEPAIRVRHIFPETWLWQMLETG